MVASAGVMEGRLPAESIARQPDLEHDCSYYAVVNFYRRMGYVAPPVEELRVAMLEEYVMPDDAGHAPPCLFSMLVKVNFPRPLALGYVPNMMGAREVFPDLIDAGCSILFTVAGVHEGRHYCHALVADWWESGGVMALDSYPEVEGGPHGRRILIPWDTAAPDPWVGYVDGLAPVGIGRAFIVSF